tara:strand:- start:361 stop:462 length:102 start_codon:yes stop_codon:yes gene_type:complete
LVIKNYAFAIQVIAVEMLKIEEKNKRNKNEIRN